ncbi:MAG: hypothetical protein QM817_12690 [Archangium sp.]
MPALVVSLCLAVVVWLMAHDAALAGRAPVTEQRLQVFFLVTAALALAWRFAGPWRLRRALREVPFPVTGFLDLLAAPAFDEEPTVELVFVDTPARVDDLLELVRAKLPPMNELGDPKVEQRQRRVAIVLQGGPHARSAFMIWFRMRQRLLHDVHAAYPLARVEVVAGSRRRDLE